MKGLVGFFVDGLVDGLVEDLVEDFISLMVKLMTSWEAELRLDGSGVGERKWAGKAFN